MSVVVFDIAEFRNLFGYEDPPFTDKMLLSAFTRAEWYVNNLDCSKIPVYDRKKLLYLATAHILELYKTKGRAGLVGRVSSASQGNVSASMDFPTTPTGAWWEQTQPGAEYWVQSAKYRSFLWVKSKKCLYR